METIFQQEQKLQRKMNQSLIQSVHILQFSSIELIQYLKEIAEENPLIDQSDYTSSLADYIYDTSEKGLDSEIWKDRERTMAEKLKAQINMIKIPTELVSLVEYGIDSLNDDGYLDISIEEWAMKRQVTIDKIQQALTMMQQLEPAGIGARTLVECILLQLQRHEGTIAPFVENLLQDHLDWIASENIQEISAKYDISDEVVRGILNQIKACHPKPGQLLQPDKTEYIIPEAYIYKSEGKWQVSFYKWSTPIIQVDPTYQSVEPEQKEAYAFLTRKHKEIVKLNRAFAYRATTLERVVHVIMQKQQLYFEYGIHAIKALTLREVAETLDLHLSTVSRAVANKYIQTSNGIIPLKFFFQAGIRQENGKQQASVSTKLLLKEILEHEDATSPYSDEVLRVKLKKEFGIHVARRTIVKYREQLNIPSSLNRKETK